MKVIGHQTVSDDSNTQELFEFSHEIDEMFFFRVTKDEPAFNHAGNAMVEAASLSLDACFSHICSAIAIPQNDEKNNTHTNSI